MNSLKKTDEIRNYWWIPLVSGIVFLVFGLWLLLVPLDSFYTLTMVFGFIILISGVYEIYFSLLNRKSILDFQSLLWSGIVNALLGLILILNPGTILVIISILIGFWLIFKGGELIKKAIDLKKSGSKTWNRPMIIGIILLVIAIILIWHPQIIGITIALWTSLAFISLGVFRIYLAFRFKKN